MVTAMYPGRFDPVTNGHMDIVRRAAALYDELIIAVAESRSTLFTTEERAELFRRSCTDLDNVRVITHGGLTVEAAQAEGAQVLVRGLRAITDFTAEFDMALMNRKMAPEVESAFLMTEPEHMFLSASRIRELASFGRDVADLVPLPVAEALREKKLSG